MKGTFALLASQLLAAVSAFKATTTRYYDGLEGACGCGDASGAFSWQLGPANGVYTAAGSQAFFDTDGSSWCGAGCGKCYNLTSTGEPPCDGCGTGGVAGESIIVMVTNLCPYNGNQVWCPNVGATNDYGYSYHFDIMAQSEVFGDNVVVDFEPVTCPGQAASDWETCVCYGQTETDETPVGLSAAERESSTSSTTTTSSTTITTTTTTTTTIKATTSATTTTTTTVAPASSSTTTSTTTSSSTTASSLTTTSRPTVVSTVTSTITKTATSTSSSCDASQTLYGQCGGHGWTGPTTCVCGSTCQEQNEWYSQCLP